MSSAKASAVKGLMVTGKLLILLNFNQSLASDFRDPKFYEYRTSGFVNQLLEMSFGWFKGLDNEQKEHYHQSITHALMMAENGQKVSWFSKDASGYSVPVYTWPTGSGFCRRLHIQAIAYGTEKTMTATACYDNAQDNWRWVKQ